MRGEYFTRSYSKDLSIDNRVIFTNNGYHIVGNLYLRDDGVGFSTTAIRLGLYGAYIRVKDPEKIFLEGEVYTYFHHKNVNIIVAMLEKHRADVMISAERAREIFVIIDEMLEQAITAIRGIYKEDVSPFNIKHEKYIDFNKQSDSIIIYVHDLLIFHMFKYKNRVVLKCLHGELCIVAKWTPDIVEQCCIEEILKQQTVVDMLRAIIAAADRVKQYLLKLKK